jgi:hypothetical protein
MVLLSPAILRLLIRGCSGIQTPSSGRHFLGLPLLPEPPTTSKVVRLAVQLQQLETHFLCDAQKDYVHPLQCSSA